MNSIQRLTIAAQQAIGPKVKVRLKAGLKLGLQLVLQLRFKLRLQSAFKPVQSSAFKPVQSSAFLVLLIMASVTAQTAQTAHAAGVSGYLPLKSNPLLEQDIERLAVLANMPQLIRPYSVVAVNQALARIAQSHPALHRRLARQLQRYNQRVALTQASVTLSGASIKRATLPDPSGVALQAGTLGDKKRTHLVNARGATTDENIAVNIRGHAQLTDWLLLSAGGDFTDEQHYASGALVSLGASWMQLDLGYKEQWVSPLHSSAMLLSNQAQTLPSISLSNTLPLMFAGMGFNYHVSLAQLSRQPTLFNDAFSTRKKPLLASIHASWQPVPWWSLGATRNFQFGGGERPVSLKTLARAFYDPRGADNDASVDEESGNQVAAVHSRMHFDGPLPFSLNIELAGEDALNHKLYQLGNPALLAGVYFPLFFHPDLAVTYEYGDWDSAWYVNNVYQKGYTNQDAVLGHWAMQDQFLGRTAAPGSSHFMSAQWRLPSQHVLDVAVRTSEHKGAYRQVVAGNTVLTTYKPAWNTTINYSIPAKNFTYSAGAYVGKDAFGQGFGQLKFSVLWN